jgi:hypothetical protein
MSQDPTNSSTQRQNIRDNWHAPCSLRSLCSLWLILPPGSHANHRQRTPVTRGARQTSPFLEPRLGQADAHHEA